jgi:hypothetical protein
MSRHGGQLQYIPWPDEEEASTGPALHDARKLLPRGGGGAPASSSSSAATPLSPSAPPPPPPTLAALPLPLPPPRALLLALGALLLVVYLLAAPAADSADAAAAAALQPAPLAPMSAALPGMGPGGPVVGSWGLRDAVLPRALTFLAIGDWGRDGRGGQEVTAPVLEAWAAATRAAFVVSVGDNVYVDGIPEGASAAEAGAILKRFFSDVYSTPYLAKTPFHGILGNHD